MAKRTKSLEDRLIDFLDRDMVRLEKKVDDNTTLTAATKKQAEETNGRVTTNERRLEQVESKIFGKSGVKESTPSNLPSVWRDKRIQNIGLVVALSFLILVAAATKFDLEKVLNFIM